MSDNKPSIEELEAKAEGGDVEAMMKLASIYGSDDNDGYDLDGTDQNEARKWFKLASDSGSMEATYYLSMYCDDETEEMNLLKKAAIMGHDDAHHEIGLLYRNKGDFKNALNWYESQYENTEADPYYRGSSAREIGSLYEKSGSYQDYKMAVKWYKIAAKLGCVSSARRLGELYTNGVRSDEYIKEDFWDGHTVIGIDEKEAAKWYLVAAENGSEGDCAKMSDLYLNGIGVIRNYQKAFQWMLKAACYYFSIYRARISSYYKKGIGIEKSYYEAYVWALMVRDKPIADKINKLENELSTAEINKAQKEAEYRSSLVVGFGFSKTLHDYMLSKVDATDTVSVINKEVKPEKPALPEVEKERSEPDPDPSPGIVYSYLSVCKKRFNPELVTLELVVPRKLKKTETMDFTRIKIKYDGKDTDAKDVSTLIPFRVNESERRLLIILAAQSSISDDEKRDESIRNILADHKNKARSSHLNSMFRAIFPGCAKSRSDRMIDRLRGHIGPKLKIDTSKLNKARDFGLCGL